MTLETVAAPAGQAAESTPAPEPEQKTPDALQEQGSEPTNDEAQGAEEGAEPRSEDGKRKRGLSERALEYRNQARDLQRLNERTLALLEKALTGQKPTVQAPEGPPRRDDFQSLDEYLEAKTDWQLAERFKVIEQRAAEAQKQRAIEQLEATWEQRLQAETEKDEAFEEYVERVGTKITPLAGVAIKEAEKGPEIVRFLGENPAELKRISQLTPAAQVREIGKIEARLESKPAAKAVAPKAPQPVTPVKGSSGDSLEAAVANAKTQAEYEAAMNKLLEARGQRRW